MESVREVDVAVVGAGLAGLVAARDVRAAGASAVVVEARDRVGGRVLNEPIGDGEVVELGGQWIGPTQDRIAALARELGVETFPTHAAGENVLEWRGELRRYAGTIPRINPAVLADVLQAQRRLERMSRRVPLDRPWLARRARAWDGQTTATWLRRNVATRAARELLQLGFESVWATQPEDVSLLHTLFYLHSSGGSLDRLFDVAGGAQQDRFVGGSQRVATELAARLGDDALILGAPVRRVEHGPDGVVLHAERRAIEPAPGRARRAAHAPDGGDGPARATGGGDGPARPEGVTVRARRAILALAPALAGRLVYDPPLPGYRDQLTQRTPLGTVAKCMAIYDEPFWRADGLSGEATSDRGPVRLTFDNSPPGGRPGVLLAFLEGERARVAGRMAPHDRRAMVLDCLERLFGARAARPEAYVEKLWAEEEFTRGCYGCHLPPGAWTGYGEALRAPVGPLHWAGAEVAEVWSGYMDGAVRSGEAAARAAVAAL